MGSASFEHAVETAHHIHELLQRSFPEGKVDRWTAGNFRGYSALDISNRYFTPRKDAPGVEHIPFENDVGPNGILESIANSGYAHSEENIVRYFTRQVDEKGDER